jgi:S-adenosyl-L-methionine hydrolase (adenosine-forming)
MPVITLTTDLGLKDHYLPSVKGAIISRCSDAAIIDISHQIEKFDTSAAAFIIRNCFREFPEGTVHLISVNEEPAEGRRFLAVEAEKHFFIGTDNGIFSLILEGRSARAAVLNPEKTATAFPLKDIFVPAACHLIKGGTIDDLGEITTGFVQQMELSSFADQDSIKGVVIYIDSYGNGITNITREQFEKAGKNRSFSIMGAGYRINEISNTYSDVIDGEVVVFFNSSGNLEIAINKGRASDLIGLKHRLPIRIEFE